MHHSLSRSIPPLLASVLPSGSTRLVMRRTCLVGFFQEVVCGDTCPRRKPDPDQMLYACERLGVAPAQAVAIGDSINDAQAGRAAGVHVLAVPYGYNEGQDVHGLDVDGIVGSIAEAAQWIALWNADRKRDLPGNSPAAPAAGPVI